MIIGQKVYLFKYNIDFEVVHTLWSSVYNWIKKSVDFRITQIERGD